MTVVIGVSAVNISAFAGMASSPSSKGRALQPHRQSDKTSTIADHDDFFKTLSPFCVLIIKNRDLRRSLDSLCSMYSGVNTFVSRSFPPRAEMR